MVEGIEHRSRDRKIDVVTDEVHEFEGSHTKTTGFAHHGIDGRHVARLLGEQAQALCVVRPRDAIDDEARRRLGVHGTLSPCGCRVEDQRCQRGIGRKPGHDFHERHQRRGVEKVHAKQAGRIA